MKELTFANPNLLYLLILIIPIIIWYILKNRDLNASIQISTLKGISSNYLTYKYFLRHLLFAIRIMALTLFLIALARPQYTLNWKNVSTEGIDIVLALDISGSMLAMDFKPDRLEASKDLAIQFISGRQTDRIGLVVFSG